MLENPMGTMGFEFIEYTSEVETLNSLFTNLGFTLTGKHRQQPVSLYQQGKINFIINSNTDGFAADFRAAHGRSACGMAFRVKDAKSAFDRAISFGAKAYTGDTSHIGSSVKAIYGVGNSLLYLIDKDNIYTEMFEMIKKPNGGVGLEVIDHLTHNVYQGQMDKLKEEFYEKIFNFTQIRYFDIQGKRTGLVSRALTSPCGNIKIPLNESKDDNSQIAEYLREYKGEGIQHIALTTKDIFSTIEQLRNQQIDFMDTPDTYYELLGKRLPEHGEDISRMQKNKILIDGGEQQGGGYLLQIFTKTVIGPIFFEIIQRKGNEGFGEGNFQALFDSIELDQIRRGVLEED